MKNNLRTDWLKLDTAAQLFPATSSPKNSSVFRLAVVLTEEIDKTKLEKAARKTLLAVPSLNLRLRKGFFKRYFELSDKPFQIEKETKTPCQYMDEHQLATHLMRILYYGNRISIEVHHTLGDGLSLVKFLTLLLSNYFETDSDLNDIRNEFNSEDSYVKYAALNHRYRVTKKKIGNNTLHIKGTFYPTLQTSVTHGHINIESLKEISRRYHVTINTLIIAILLLAIQNQETIKKNKMIKIAIPVNLRAFFPSETLRNFFGVVNIVTEQSNKQSFEHVLRLVDSQLKQQLQKDELLKNFSGNVSLEQQGLNSFTPLVMRERVLKMGFKYFSESNKTMTVSNLGILKVPDTLDGKISHFEAIPYPTIMAPISCGIISYQDDMVITFIKNIKETALIDDFFSILTSIGIHVEVHNNQI